VEGKAKTNFEIQKRMAKLNLSIPRTPLTQAQLAGLFFALH
jgi:hypothetical protein